MWGGNHQGKEAQENQRCNMAEFPQSALPIFLLGSVSTITAITSPVFPSTTGSKSPNLAHTALIFQMLHEHLNFSTSISAPPSRLD